MSDIVQRLRESATQARALDRSELLNEAADEIERLRISDEQAWAIEYAAKLAFKENNGGFVADCLRRLLKEKETFPQVK